VKPFDAVATLIALVGAKPRVVVAYSGGLDSTVLAHALSRARRKLGGLRLVHVDHGLQAPSADWARHCARQARRWRVPLRGLRAQGAAHLRGESPEAAARDARYAQFEQELRPGEVLVTAHHLDDQVETFLLQLFRGAGVAGLASMPPVREFAEGWIARPLLDVRRDAILAYANSHRLSWIEDPSNQLTRYGRNHLRQEVVPLLRKRWPGVDATIARTARHMAEAARLLDARASSDLMSAADGTGLNVAALRRLPMARRRNALRLFIARTGVESPSAAKMAEISGALLAARPDAQPQVEWGGALLRRRSGKLELQVVPEKPLKPARETVLESWCWNDERELLLNSGERLLLVDDVAGPLDLDKLPTSLEVRARRGGESLRPGPKARTQALKKLLQAARLSVEQRARLPLLYGAGPQGRLIAAGDRWQDASVMATVKSRRRGRLIWKRDN
jgi:tRNA(Ile)-lysidine synthase